MRGFTKKLIAILVVGGLFSYLVLPGLIENQIAGRLQEAFGTPTKPEVEVSSSFPPELLLGRIDRIQVKMDQMSVQGFALYNARVDLRGVKVSVPTLLEGHAMIESGRGIDQPESGEPWLSGSGIHLVNRLAFAGLSAEHFTVGSGSREPPHSTPRRRVP